MARRPRTPRRLAARSRRRPEGVARGRGAGPPAPLSKRGSPSTATQRGTEPTGTPRPEDEVQVEVVGVAAAQLRPDHQFRRDLEQEPRRDGRLAHPPGHPPPRVRQVQPALGAGDPDVGEPSFLLELLLVVERPAVREQALLEAGDEHDRELEALGGMEGDERDRVGVALVRILVGDERGLLEQPVQRVLGRQVVVSGRHARAARAGWPSAPRRPPSRPRASPGSRTPRGPRRGAPGGPARRSGPAAAERAPRSRPAGSERAARWPAARPAPPARSRSRSSPPSRAAAARSDLDRLVADPSRRDVDDPLEADAVRVGPQDAQVGEGVLDLAPGIEPGAADQLVAKAVAQERLLDRSGLGVHPVHHRDVPCPERAPPPRPPSG